MVDLSFPSHVNWKCVILTLVGYAIYIVSTVIIPKFGLRGTSVASAITAVLSIMLAILYHSILYRCKTPLSHAWIGVLLFGVMMALIPFLAYGMELAVKKFPRQTSWRKYQMMQATRYVLVPLLLGIILYVLLNRYDWTYDCLVKMEPTAISAPSAFMKSPEYRAKLKDHLPQFIFWSSIFYMIIIGGSITVAGLVRFKS